MLTGLFSGTLRAAESPQTAGQTERIAIQRFAIVGNTLLPQDEVERLVSPFAGSQRDYGDIQRALETLELAYRSRGFAAVNVHVPEQELTGGVVTLKVLETVVGRVQVQGKPRHFNEENVRAALPALREGSTPNAQDLSAQIALANENPARQLELVLGVGAVEGQVDVKLNVVEHDPRQFSITLDNTGNTQTGRERVGVAFQHANLWNRDHVASVAYQTSPEKPDQVDILSLSYRLPIYAWAGALDFILAKSSVNAGATPTTAGMLSFAGSGVTTGVRYTQALPRRGDVSQKVVVGWDVKANDNACSLGVYGATGCGAAAVDTTLRPLSVSYNRAEVAPGYSTELTLSLVHNLPGGKNGRDADFQAARPSPTGATGARANYHLLKGNLTHLRVLDGDWQLRFAGSAQWTDMPLLSHEHIGLAGSNAVRGFQEREVARDTGIFFNAEAYTPNLGERLGTNALLRALLFVDAGAGRNRLLAGESQPKDNSVASWGFGVRYNAGRDVAAKLDIAQVIVPNGNQRQGDWRGHFSLNLAF